MIARTTALSNLADDWFFVASAAILSALVAGALLAVPAWAVTGRLGTTGAIYLLLSGTILLDLWRASRRGPDRSLLVWDWGLFALVLLLVAAPTMSSNWGALFLSGLWVSCRGNRPARPAGVMLMMTALYLLKDGVWAGFIAEAILEQEAALVAWIYKLVSSPASADGNIISFAYGRSLVVLRDCSLLNQVGPAVLAVLALRRILHPQETRYWRHAALMALTVVFLNMLRLVAMAWSDDFHHFFHDGLGADIFAAVISIAAGLMALARAPR